MPRKSTPKRYHVVKSIQGWKVELENSAWSEFRSPVRKDVIQKAIQLAQKEKEGYVIIHKPDGTIEEERLFSRDAKKNEEQNISE
jgi:16S rRNA U516 pseudouridylate synthase RsuA-like enzyme